MHFARLYFKLLCLQLMACRHSHSALFEFAKILSDFARGVKWLGRERLCVLSELWSFEKLAQIQTVSRSSKCNDVRASLKES